MRSWLVVSLVFAAFAGGWLASTQLFPLTQPGSSHGSAEKAEPLYWVAPMDANYRSDKPGKSPMGMDLVPVYDDGNEGPDDGGVTIQPNVVANLGVRKAEVTQGPLSKPIITVGYVTYDEEKLLHIHSRVAGWVERLNVEAEGEAVKEGQTLFEIYSPDLVLAQEEYLQAKRSGRSAMQEGARRKLAVLGVSPKQIDELSRRGTSTQRIAIKAPATGHLAELGIRQGMYIRPDTQVMAIGTLDSVWVIGEFFERQAGLIDEGDTVTITVPAFRGQEWNGTVDYVYPVLNPQSRTLRARVRIENGDRILRPNMFVNLSLLAPLGESVISVPTEAVIRGGERDHVIVAEGQGRFRPVPVTIGKEAGNRMVVLEGLEPGQQVVTSAQFLIDSETNLEVALSRLSANQAMSAETGAANAVNVAATIVGLMPDTRTLTLEHESIPQWQWPAMTMEFKAAESLAFDKLEVGQRITAVIENNGDQGYSVTAIEIADAEQDEKQGKPAESTGVIRSLDTKGRSITLAHEPIPALGWPAMEMAFGLAGDAGMAGLEVGDEVRFGLLENAKGELEIISVQPVNLNH